MSRRSSASPGIGATLLALLVACAHTPAPAAPSGRAPAGDARRAPFSVEPELDLDAPPILRQHGRECPPSAWPLADPRVAYFGPTELLEPDLLWCDGFHGRFDVDMLGLACTHLLGAVMGPAYVDALPDGGLLLDRKPHCPYRISATGLSLTLVRDFPHEGVERRLRAPAVWSRGMALPDITGDGWPDVCLTQPWLPHESRRADVEPERRGVRVRAVDVAQAAELWVSEFGGADDELFLSPPVRCPDLDGDAREDLLLVRGEYGSEALRIVALSSWNGATLATWHHAWEPAATRGWSQTVDLALLEAPTPDRDGRARWTLVLRAGDAQLVELELGARHTPRVLCELRAADLRVAALGTPVPVGDLDGDARVDVAFGCPGSTYECGDAAARSGRLVRRADGAPDPRWHHGAVLFVSGADGRELGAVEGRACTDTFGAALIPWVDVTGDGIAELLVGAPRARAGAVSLVDPAARRTLASWPHDARGRGWPGIAGLGTDLAVIPDRDGDGLPEVLVSAADGEASRSCDAFTDAQLAGVLCVSSRGFFTPRSRDRDPGFLRDG